jgi:FkbH-like protein
MKALDYIALYREATNGTKKELRPLAVNLITNFTDDILARIFGGVSVEAGFLPSLTRAPYKQYHIVLADPAEWIGNRAPDISFFFFDITAHLHSEFHSSEHLDETVRNVRRYCEAVGKPVVFSLPLVPYAGPYGHLHAQDPVFLRVTEFSTQIRRLAAELPNLSVFDTNKIAHSLGEATLRDMRGLYAFDIPFSTEFFAALAQEWLAVVVALTGRSRKCIVVDLDNTLWGGVLGEAGPLGIALGPGYPGLAYQSFQRALLSYLERGIILAIASKNNIADVHEVFATNPHMILKEEHFASMQVHWNDKADSLQAIARELNIGTDSLVFVDDSPLERGLVAQALPEVLVPDFSIPPEQYSQKLFSLHVFHQMSLTEEDRRKGAMYAEEHKRKAAERTAVSKDEYIAKLGITLKISRNGEMDLPRVAQLTQKTNQFNLTTRRYDISDVQALLADGGLGFSGEVTDKFGQYGTVIVALVRLTPGEAILDTFLMSCRAMGRTVEQAFLRHIVDELARTGVRTLRASFIPTAKNEPASRFLADMGFDLVQKSDAGAEEYVYGLCPAATTTREAHGAPLITVL